MLLTPWSGPSSRTNSSGCSGEIGKTIIMVTHDIDEALKLGDQVAVMRVGGHLAQMATPSELLTAPADDFVADFVGRDRGSAPSGSPIRPVPWTSARKPS